MSITLNKNIKNDENAVESFNKLAIDVFDLSFKKWYKSGYWRDKYFPYTLFDGDKAVANVSASMIHTKVNGQPKLYIQIGTVMTDPQYRNKGLSRRLMEEILNDFEDKCDGIYLYANDSVLDFYPKFGFAKEKEYQYSKSITPSSNLFRKLDMNKTEDRAIFESYYNKNNPFSDRPMIDNFGLVIIPCAGFFTDCVHYSDGPEYGVYYSEKLDSVVVATFEDDNMICYDIYCDEDKNRETILEAVVNPDTSKVTFGFMPKDIEDCEVRELENEDQLFVYNKKENMFRENYMMLPLLSHA